MDKPPLDTDKLVEALGGPEALLRLSLYLSRHVKEDATPIRTPGVVARGSSPWTTSASSYSSHAQVLPHRTFLTVEARIAV